jgi:hypothetical protein
MHAELHSGGVARLADPKVFRLCLPAPREARVGRSGGVRCCGMADVAHPHELVRKVKGIQDLQRTGLNASGPAGVSRSVVLIDNAAGNAMPIKLSRHEQTRWTCPTTILGCPWPSGYPLVPVSYETQSHDSQRATLDIRASVPSGPPTLPDMRPVAMCRHAPGAPS